MISFFQTSTVFFQHFIFYSGSVRRLAGWRWHYLHDWGYCALVYEFTVCYIVFKEPHHKNILKIAFPLPSRVSSLRVLRLNSANGKELHKTYLRLKAPVSIRTMRLTEILAFFTYIKKLGVARGCLMMILLHTGDLVKHKCLGQKKKRFLTAYYLSRMTHE